MGYYSEYLDKNLSFDELINERKKQLKIISNLRGDRDILVIAADLNKGNAPIGIDFSDILPVTDQLSNLNGTSLDLILETPGGSGEVAEDIVHLLHNKYKDVAVIIPGYAKSAGTIMAMSGDEILMDTSSALGPIDAQLQWQGKTFSADALLEGFEKIKEEVIRTGILNRAYIPILQGISPGELQEAENALKFAKVLVTEWLAKYKFKNWERHSSTGKPVTKEDKKKRAEEIADQLCKHSSWFTHGRSIKIDDFNQMRLLITDYSKDAKLAEPIRRYYALLQLTLSTNIYKIIETPISQIFRFIVPQAPLLNPGAKKGKIIVDVVCNKCKHSSKIQANIGEKQPIEDGCIPFPENNKLNCPSCTIEMDLTDLRRQIESQTKGKIV
ncbi:MAG: Clp protease ClpP [Bacteroidetes bacterium]|nr:Clp protease ClpP [Bacteroidota bacterium]